jgi:2,3-bisphosphoglycerate-independent phosphoglycerate mutase
MLVIGGLADAGVGEGSGKSALEAARTPGLDSLATEGILGMTRLLPEGVVPTTTATVLAALGYGPVEDAIPAGVAVALGLGAQTSPDDRLAVLDLVTAGVDEAGAEIVSGVGGAYLTRRERLALACTLADALGANGVTVHPGSQAAVVLAPGGFVERPGPPWAALGSPLTGAESDAALRRAARAAIENAPIVVARRTGGAAVPTDVWVWGGGCAPPAPAPFAVSGMLLADEPAPLGVGRHLGLDVGELGGPEDEAGGWERVVPAIMASVEHHVFTLAHVGAVDALGHRGDGTAKAAMIQAIDRELVEPLRQAMEGYAGDWRLAVVAGHVTSTTTRAHTADPVPFVVYASRPEHRSPHVARGFHERDAREQGIFIPDGRGLIGRLMRR